MPPAATTAPMWASHDANKEYAFVFLGEKNSELLTVKRNPSSINVDVPKRIKLEGHIGRFLLNWAPI
jgi:hypothetical protein